MNKTISRRHALKLIAASGMVVYLQPFGGKHRAFAAEGKATSFAGYSPIDRTLADVAPQEFFADDPELAHKVLWDKTGFLKSSGLSIPAPKEKVPLVVVGGGIAGLFSSYLLRDYKPVILEQDVRFGGNAKGQSWRGIDYSIGAAYFIEPEPESDIENILKELGIPDIWKIKEEEDPVAIGGSIYKGFWSGESLEGDEKGKAQIEKLAKYFSDVNEGEEIPYPDIPITDPELEPYIKDLDKVSFKAHLEKILGEPLHHQIETALEQYCWSSMGASASEVSAAGGLNFYASEFSNVAILPGGNAAVAEKVLERLTQTLPAGNFRPRSLVFDISVVNDGVVVAYLDAAGSVHSIHAKSVVVSAPKFVVGKILNGIEPERLLSIVKLKYRSYLVANVCLKGGYTDPFYDLYLLGDGKIDASNIQAASQKQKATDVILASYAKPDANNTVLTLYRGMPYDGARAELYSPGSFGRYRDVFMRQVTDSILPLLKLKKEDIVDMRVARWGHPLVVSAPGLIADGTLEQVRRPFKNRVFFVEQDNWALPAFETSLTEALLWAPEVKKVLA